MTDLFDLTGKVAVITGSSRGIGRAIAEAMADRGARVVISSRKQDACEAVAEAINAQHPGAATAIAASISSKVALEDLVARTQAKVGPIDVLVCNAASNPYYGPMSGISDDQFRKILDNNVLSNHWLIQLCLPGMIARKDGAIVVISSIGGLRGSATLGAYAVSKAADLALVRNLAVEVGQHNIRANAIAPGLIRTDFARALWDNPEAQARFSSEHPMRRIGEPVEIAGAAVFLASRAGSYVNGQTIVVDGGVDDMSGMNAERLARIAPFLEERYIGPGKLPMADILVARDGEPVYRATLGNARADGTPLKPDAIFRIASMTKPVTSIAFMQLVEEGKVALDDAVARVIPEFAKLGVYNGGGGAAPFAPVKPCAPMRMVDLLSHMSGLTYGFQNRTSVDAAYRETLPDGGRSMQGFDWFIAELAKIPLEFAPGTGWNYSVSTDVLGVVVARIAGKPLGQVLAERIFAPLGLVDTGFHLPEAERARLTDCWAYVPGKPPKLIDKAIDSKLTAPAKFEGGGGGLVSTVADYDRFCRMLIGRGALDGQRIVGPKTLDLMTRNQLPGGADLAAVSKSLFSEASNAGAGFGLGFAMTLDPARTLIPGSAGEFYWGGMYSTFFFIDPVERLHMVFMTQLSPSSSYPVRRQLKTLIYGAVEESYA